MTTAAHVPETVAAIYVVGVVVGLFATDAALPARIALSLLWPLGPLAFVVTVAILMTASVVAFPLAAAVAVAAAAFLWLSLRPT